MKANLSPGWNLAPNSVAEQISKVGSVKFPQRCPAFLLCKDHCSPLSGRNRARPDWISSSNSSLVAFCLHSPLKRWIRLNTSWTLLSELSLFGWSWYLCQLAQSWGAQQGAGERGSLLPGWGHFPSWILQLCRWSACRKWLCSCVLQPATQASSLCLLHLLAEHHIQGVDWWRKSRAAELLWLGQMLDDGLCFLLWCAGVFIPSHSHI